MSEVLGGIRLEWKVNTINGEGQYVYRSTSPIDTEYPPEPLANIPPSVNYYEDNTVISNVLYYYRIASYSGTEMVMSDEFPIFSAPRGPSFVTGYGFSTGSDYINNNSVVWTGTSWLMCVNGATGYVSGNGLYFEDMSMPMVDVSYLSCIGNNVIAGTSSVSYSTSTVSRSTNNGVNWNNSQYFTHNERVWALGSFSYSNLFYAYTARGSTYYLRYTTDFGVNWTAVSLPFNNNTLRITEEAVLNDTPMCFLFGNNGFFYYSYDGISWVLGENMAIFGQIIGSTVIKAGQTNRIYVVDHVGNVAYSEDGINYIPSTPLNGAPRTFASDGRHVMVAALSDGTLDTSMNYGVTWYNVPVGSQWDSVSNHGVFYGKGFGWLHLTYGNDGGSNYMRPAVSV